jgi:hypothetical protein
MNARHPIALTAAAFLLLGLATPTFAAPEGLGEAAMPTAVTATPTETAAPTKKVTTEAARPATRRARPVRAARHPRTVRPATRVAQPVSRTVRPRIYQVASSAPIGCQSITCMGGVLLLGVGF